MPADKFHGLNTGLPLVKLKGLTSKGALPSITCFCQYSTRGRNLVHLQSRQRIASSLGMPAFRINRYLRLLSSGVWLQLHRDMDMTDRLNFLFFGCQSKGGNSLKYPSATTWAFELPKPGVKPGLRSPRSLPEVNQAYWTLHKFLPHIQYFFTGERLHHATESQPLPLVMTFQSFNA